MIGLFWNIRALGQPAKFQCLYDTIKNYNIGFIGFQETKREQLSANFFAISNWWEKFIWHFLPADGSAGGILLGLNVDLFDVIGFSSKKFSVSGTIVNKSDAFTWNLVVIYGTSYPDIKMDFIAEIHDLCEHLACPIVLRGILTW